MSHSVPFKDNLGQFTAQPAGHGRMTLTERVRGGHFWPVYTGLLGLVFVALAAFIVWGLVTGEIQDGSDDDVPPMGLLLLLCGGMATMCLWAAFAHFAHHRRKLRYAPAVLNLPSPLRGGQPVRLSFSKKRLSDAGQDTAPHEVRARLELIETSREAPHRDSDYNERDAQRQPFYPVKRTLWEEALRPASAPAAAGFAAEWEFTPPDPARLPWKPNVVYAQFLLTIELRRENREFLEPLRVLLPLE